MDRNTVIGIILMVGLFIGYILLQPKPEPEAEDNTPDTEQVENNDNTAPENIQAPGLDTGSTTTPVAVIDSAAQDSINQYKQQSQLQSQYGAFQKAANGQDDTYILENDYIRVNLASKGGFVESVELLYNDELEKTFLDQEGENVKLFSHEFDEFYYTFAIAGNKVINTNELYFKATSESQTDTSISLYAYAGEGKYLEQRYALSPKSYMIDYDLRLVGLNDIIPQNTVHIDLHWQNELERLEHNLTYARRYSSIYYRFVNEDVDHLGYNKKEDEEELETVTWLAFKQQFFNSSLFVPDGFKGTVKAEFGKEDEDYVKRYYADMKIPYTAGQQEYNMQLYFGPNHYYTLKSYDNDLEDIVQLSPDFFLTRWFNIFTKFLILPAFNWLNGIFGNYGIIILIMAFMIKMLLMPVTYRSYKYSVVMKILKPELDELKEKYKDDQQKLGTEQMKLYSRAGVNPLSGCIPMLLQMPILIAMYYFFPSSVELRGEAFLWAQDLSTYDSIVTFSKPIFLGLDHISLFTILMTVSSILYSATNMQMSSSQPGMKYMPYIFPIFLFFIFNSFPAALTYYYFLFNIISYGQQFVIKKFFISETKLKKQIEHRKKNPKKKSGWAARLEDIQRQQKEVQKQKGNRSNRRSK